MFDYRAWHIMNLFTIYLLISFKTDSDGDTLNATINKFKY